MPDQTPILALPVLVPNQAQPYVTHNEALRRLDILVQMSILEFDAETPPALPEEGDLYALGAAPGAGWAGQAHKLAAWIDGAWLFVAPQEGWRAWDGDMGVLRVWDGAGWVRPPADLDNVAGLGIGTAADPVNRLAVKSDAVLFSHDGAGHQLKINKAADSDTASLLFQSGWTGHAEIGLAGDTDLVLKVSADGSAWTEALRFDAASGEAFGAALQSGAGDTTAGRIPKMGNDADFADLIASGITVTANNPVITLTDNNPGTEGSHSIKAVGSALFLEADDAGEGADSSVVLQVDNATKFAISSGAIVSRTTGDGASTTVSRLDSTHSSYDGVMSFMDTARAASSAYYFASWRSGSSDTEFRVRGDGEVTADGSFNGNGADYAEFFEWADGNPDGEDRRGLSVGLDGDRIRPAQPGEEPIGVISANPSVVGDGDIDRWKGKYLRDDFGAYVWEDYEIEGEDRKPVTQQRRKLNPNYDPDLSYTPRAERPEWDTVGLMGKLRLRKDQPVGARWIKMRDVSAEVEEWLVR